VNFRTILCLGVFLTLALLIAAPLAAASTPANARDDPQLISGLKIHVAYYGELQQAQMDGTIRYINTISNGTGISALQNYEEDYMVAASSVPSMNSADDITAARDTMQTKSRKFSAETQVQMMKYGGKPADLGKWVNASVSQTEDSILRSNGTYWLAQNTSRLVVFNYYSVGRSAILQNLEQQGMNVTDARQVSETIDAQRPALKDAVLNDRFDALKETNSAIDEQNRKFRDLVTGYQDQVLLRSAIAAQAA